MGNQQQNSNDKKLRTVSNGWSYWSNCWSHTEHPNIKVIFIIQNDKCAIGKACTNFV